MIKISNWLMLICLLLAAVQPGCDSLDAIDPLDLQLTIAASPASVIIEEFSTITATLTKSEATVSTTSTGSTTTTTTTPVSGYPVNFAITQNITGCTITVVNSVTDSSGKAIALYKAGTIAGIDIVRASLENGKNASVSIIVTLQ